MYISSWFQFKLFYEFRNNQKPDYIKIDVDGIEHLILEGASLLKNLSNIEILIEINDNFIEQKICLCFVRKI